MLEILFAILEAMLVPAVYHLVVFGLLAATVALAWREAHESGRADARAFFIAAAIAAVLHLLLGLYEAAARTGAVGDALPATLESLGWVLLAAASWPVRAGHFRLIGAVALMGGVAVALATVLPGGPAWLWPGAAALASAVAAGWRFVRRPPADGDHTASVAFLFLAFAQVFVAVGGPAAGRPLIYAALLELLRAITGRLTAEHNALDAELRTVSREAARQTVSQLFLVEAMRALVSSLDLDTVLRNVLESVALAVGADRAAILLLDATDRDTLVLASHYDPVHQAIGDMEPLRVSLAAQPALAQVLRDGRPLALGAVEHPLRRQMAALVGAVDVGPVVVEPLLLRGKALGVLIVCHGQGKPEFSPDQAEFLHALGGQMAAAVENARLYRQLDRHADELSQLLRSREADVTQRQAILESIADGVVVCDATANVILMNAAAEAILGMSREELFGRPFDDAVHALSNAREVAVRNLMALTSERPFKFETEIDGGARVLQGSLAVVRTVDDIEPLGTVVVLRDVTRERQAERAKATFITTVSHELRTPLTAIKGYLHFLVTGAAGALAPMQQQFVRTIQENSERIVTLVNDMILVSEMEGGGIRPHYVLVEPGPLLAKIVAEAGPAAVQGSLQISYRQGGDLPAVEADPGQLRTILEHLLSNALKFTAAGGRVTVTAKSEALAGTGDAHHYLVVEVADTGIGIPPEQQAHLFERFYHPDERPQEVRAGGMGVGLSIVRSLVEAHGGRVWVQSRVGEGSAFTFVIPSERPRPEHART